MQDILDKALPLVWGVWKFRWIVLLCTCLACLVGWTVVGSMEYRYQARARIFVDTNRVLQPLLQGITVQPDVKGRVALMSRALLTRPNLEKLVRMTDIDHDVETPEEYELLLRNLAQRLSLRSGRRDNTIYTVHFADTDPDIARRAVQALITIFIESNLGDQREDSQSAQTFLDDQIEDYEKRLKDAEDRLSEFRRQNVGIMPGESGGYFQRLDTARTQLRDAEQELREVSNRRSELARQLEQERTQDTSAVTSSAQLTRIQGLQDELDELLVRYTERHPRVSQLREMIADLRETPAPVNAVTDAAQQGRFQESLVYQNLRTSLSEAEARVAELTSRVSSFDNDVNQLELTVDSIPQVEAELQQLDRDYETFRVQHGLLLEKRESARLSKSLEQDVDDVKFRIIDPPFVPSKPNSPNKSLLTGVVTLASLGFGIGVSLLLVLLRPVFFGDRTLSRLTGHTVLGSVSLFETPRAKTRRRMANTLYVMFCGLLVMVFAGLVYLHSNGITMEELVSRPELQAIHHLRDSAFVQNISNSDVVRKMTEFFEGLL